MSKPLLYCLTCHENSRVRKVRATRAGERWSISICLNKGCKERVRTCQLAETPPVCRWCKAGIPEGEAYCSDRCAMNDYQDDESALDEMKWEAIYGHGI